MASKKYYFSKLSVSGNIFSPNVNVIINELIPEVILNKNNAITYYKSQYKFTDTYKIEVDGNTYIHGNLAKAKKVKALIIEDGNTKEKEYDDLGASVAEFIYDITTEVVAYRPTSDIKNENFVKFFKELIETDIRIGELKLIPYTKKNKIREVIRSFDVVTELNFYLIKPNAGRKEFYDFENIILENNLKELDLKMANKEGIKYTKDEDENEFTDSIESGISLVESAYGTLDVKGYNKTRIKVPGKKDKINKKKGNATSAKFNRFLTVHETDVRDIIRKIGQEIKKILD